MREVASLGQLKNPVLIAGFVTHRRAGRIGSRAAAYLVSQWKAELVARTDAEDFTDFTVDRPESRYVNEERTLQWPDTLLYRATPEGASRDFLLCVGFEPNVRWRQFVAELVDFATAAGIKTLVSLRGFAANVPHTRPTPLRLTSSDTELGESFGIQDQGSRYEGPTDILGVIAAAGQERGWQTVDLSILQPSYYPRMRNAAATIAVVTALDKAFGTSTPIDFLEARATQQLAEIDAQAPPGKEFSTMVREFEEAYDAAMGRAEFLIPTERSSLPPGQDVVDEIERLLRRPPGSDPGPV